MICVCNIMKLNKNEEKNDGAFRKNLIIKATDRCKKLLLKKVRLVWCTGYIVSALYGYGTSAIKKILV